MVEENMMRRVRKLAGGGRVTIELLEQGPDEFFARVYPTWDQARELVREEERRDGGPGYPGNGSAEAWSKAFSDRHDRQLEYGRGRDLDSALADLEGKLKEAKRK